MAKTYRPYVPEQDLLLPPSLREWLPEDHLAFFVSDLIDQLDLSAITAAARGSEGCRTVGGWFRRTWELISIDVATVLRAGAATGA